jgi:hypothetical protein
MCAVVSLGGGQPLGAAHVAGLKAVGGEAGVALVLDRARAGGRRGAGFRRV